MRRLTPLSNAQSWAAVNSADAAPWRLRSELTTLMRHDIRFKVIGRVDELAADIRQELEDLAPSGF